MNEGSYTIIGIIALMWAVAVGALAWYVGQRMREITYVTLADGRRQERSLPLMYRLLLPFTPNFHRMADSPVFARTRENLDRQLVSAGFEGLLSARDFLSLRLMMPTLVGGVVVGLLHLLFMRIPGGVGDQLRTREPLFFLTLIAFFAAQPGMWLNGAQRARHKNMEIALPFVLDLLTLSVEAGLDFMTAIKRILDRRPVDALGEELIRVFREIQLGKTRRDALRDMAERVRQPDIRSVTNALVQADELGVSIGSILRIQSDQMRVRRFLNAEKAANEAPVKMLFPLIFFIFPSVFLVLLGPVLLQLLQQGF